VAPDVCQRERGAQLAAHQIGGIRTRDTASRLQRPGHEKARTQKHTMRSPAVVCKQTGGVQLRLLVVHSQRKANGAYTQGLLPLAHITTCVAAATLLHSKYTHMATLLLTQQ